MQIMRKMKDSGIEWIGEIPEGWEVGQIGQLYSERRTKVSDKDYPPLSLVGRIHAVGLGQHVQEAVADLLDVVLEGVVLDFVRDVAVGNQHLLVGHVGGSDQLDVLHAAVHLRAGVHTSDGVEEVIAALDRTLHECSAVLAGVVGHVVGCDVE